MHEFAYHTVKGKSTLKCPQWYFTTSAKNFYHNKCELCPHWYSSSGNFSSVKCNLTQMTNNSHAGTAKIRLEYNNINNIVAGVFGYLSKCTNLFLSRNNIFVLEPRSFRGLSMLRELCLAGNKISVIHTGKIICPNVKY